MSDPIQDDAPPVRPRPGIVNTLGVMNLVFAVVLTFWLGASALFSFAMASANSAVEVKAKSATVQVNTLAFMGDPVMIRFYVIDLVTGIPLNILMFATGIGLVNFKRWGAKWWTWTAWAKIVRLILVYSYFIVGVVPTMSAGIARMVVGIFEAQKIPAGRAPSLSQLTMIYSYIYGAMGILMIVAGVIYPALSIWMLARPGAKAALTTKMPPNDWELSPP